MSDLFKTKERFIFKNFYGSSHTEQSILIIEDNFVIGLDYQYISERAGFKSLGIIKDGSKALAFIENNNPDVILLDIHLDDSTSGLEIAKVIEKKKIRYIVITGNPTEELKNLKPLVVFQKPFNNELLLKVLKDLKNIPDI